MKVIEWHCEFLRFQDRRVSTRPSGIRGELNPRISGSYSNILALFVCVEKGDSIKEVKELVGDIQRRIDTVQIPRKLVIVPFVHLSSSIASPKEAKGVLGSLHTELRALGVEVDAVSFGYHKEFELNFKAYGHPMAVAFRSFPHAGN